MAAITFPRDYPASMRVVGMTFLPMPHAELTPTRGGTLYAAELGDTRWRASYETPPLDADQVDEISAWYSTLLSYETFWGYDLRREYPKAYPNGWGSLVYGGLPFNGNCRINAITDGGKLITLDMLPANFVLSVGDYIAFDFGAVDGTGQRKRALHRVVAGDTGASITVEVRPPITYSGVNTSIVTNPSFTTPDPSSGWAQGTGWAVPAGGNAVGTNVPVNQALSQAIGLEPGHWYRVVWIIGSRTTGALQLNLGGGANGQGAIQTTVDTFTEVLQAGADARIFIHARTAAFNGTVAQVNVYPAVSLYKPAAKMVIVPDSYNEPIDLLRHGRITFDAIQVL
jgi:hypothetical protein